MPRKSKSLERTDDPAWNGLVAKQETMPIGSLRLPTEGSPNLYDESHYSMRVGEYFSPDIIVRLLELQPIIVVRIKRKLEVVSGARLFSIAALCLDPSTKIPVLVLDRRSSAGDEELLRYLDLAVMPLLYTLSGSAYDLHQVFKISRLHEQVWRPPLNSATSAFARALGVTQAAVHTPPSRERKKVRKANTPPASNET
jgi:hypothetical protein